MRHREGSAEDGGRLRVLEGGRPASPRAGKSRAAAAGGKRAPTRGMKKRRRLVLAFLTALAVGLVVFVLFGPVTRYLESRRALSDSRAELEREKAETAELEARKERAKTEEFIETEARGMGYVKPGEIPIIVIDEKKDEGEAQDTGEPPAP